MDPITLPTANELATQKFTSINWLTYYLNMWTRNVVARTVDVQADQTIKDKDPNEEVEGTGRPIKVSQRLEERKILLEDALKTVTAIEALLALSEEDLKKKFWSPEALKVDETLLNPGAEQPEVGQACVTAEGKPGVIMKNGDKLVCMPTSEKKEPEAPAAPAKEGGGV